MDDSIAGLRAFVALAESGGFSSAAQQLGLSRPAVSKAVSRLEERLGVRLVERSSRHLQLTGEGRALQLHGRNVLDALAEAHSALSSVHGLSGDIRIDLPSLFGRRWVMPVIRRLAQGHEGLRFDVSFSSRVSELVAEGVDLAVRIGELADRAELIARPLGVQPIMLCAAPQYLASRGVPQAVEDLAEHECLLPDRTLGWSWLSQLGIRHRGALNLRDSGAIVDAAVAGFGIAQLPTWLAEEHLSSGRLVRVLPEVVLPSLPIHAVWPRGRYLPPRVRLVIDALVAEFAAQQRFVS